MQNRKNIDWEAIVKNIDAGLYTQAECFKQLGISLSYGYTKVAATRKRINEKSETNYVVLKSTDEDPNEDFIGDTTKFQYEKNYCDLKLTIQLNNKIISLGGVNLINLSKVLEAIQNV